MDLPKVFLLWTFSLCCLQSAIWGQQRPSTAFVFQGVKTVRTWGVRDVSGFIQSGGEETIACSCCLRTPSSPTCCQKVFSSVLVISLSGTSFFLTSAVHLGCVLVFDFDIYLRWTQVFLPEPFQLRLPVPSLPVCQASLTLRCGLQPGTSREALWHPDRGQASSTASGMWHVCSLDTLRFFLRSPWPQ